MNVFFVQGSHRPHWPNQNAQGLHQLLGVAVVDCLQHEGAHALVATTDPSANKWSPLVGVIRKTPKRFQPNCPNLFILRASSANPPWISVSPVGGIHPGHAMDFIPTKS